MNIKEVKRLVENKSMNEIKVLPYLPFIQKALLIQDIIDNCVKVSDTGMKTIDYLQKKFCTDVYVMREYAGITFDIDEITDESQSEVVEYYDWLKTNGVVEYVYKNMYQSDFNELELIIEKTLEQEINTGNSLENIVSKGIEQLLNKIPDVDKKTISKWINDAKKSINNFDPAKYKMVQDVIDITTVK